jgi:2-polyprenyl-3-methyl-5-hydroxy-6-metoxy-1,4-benzoquinol methylase
MITPTLSMDFAALDDLQNTMQDNLYLEYVFHKLFDDPAWTWKQAKQYAPVWTFSECWRARYWLYYHQHREYLQGARILDLASNMNFYGVWALLNGASNVVAVESDETRSKLGQEYVTIRGLQNQLQTHTANIDDYLNQSRHQPFDIVFFMDVMYYLTNGIETLAAIKDRIRPKYVFFESSVVDDHTEHGHYEVWYPSTDTKKIQSFSHSNNEASRLALKPSRKALYNTIISQGWRIISYYDYKDFVGHGESPPRRSGHKDFYLLENLTGSTRH